VPAALIEEHGAVSEQVARAMAEAARAVAGSAWGVATTGVAGPGGGSAAKPVGTVHIAVAGPPARAAGGNPGAAEAAGAVEVSQQMVRLPGDRERIRWLASQIALELLRRRLLGAAGAVAAIAAGEVEVAAMTPASAPEAAVPPARAARPPGRDRRAAADPGARSAPPRP
jgi:PncC family amidohydrolase